MPICFYTVRNHGEGKRTNASMQIDSASDVCIERYRCSERLKPLSSQPAIVFAGFFCPLFFVGQECFFPLWAPAGLYKSEESAVARVICTPNTGCPVLGYISVDSRYSPHLLTSCHYLNDIGAYRSLFFVISN